MSQRMKQSPPFLAFLEALTGIGPLIVDPTLFGAGLHQILRNGSLQIHADFNSHRQLRLERRVNVFLFLNHDWDDAWGGELELWNRPMTQCEARIAPVRNRLVVFSSTDYSYHGHADPLACPPHRSRRSIAMYYYTRDRPQWKMVLGNRTNGKPIRHSTLPAAQMHHMRGGALSRHIKSRSHRTPQKSTSFALVGIKCVSTTGNQA